MRNVFSSNEVCGFEKFYRAEKFKEHHKCELFLSFSSLISRTGNLISNQPSGCPSVIQTNEKYFLFMNLFDLPKVIVHVKKTFIVYLI